MFCTASLTRCRGVGCPLEIRMDEIPFVAIGRVGSPSDLEEELPLPGREWARRDSGSCWPTKLASLRYLLRVHVPA
jgi:hypothetical protein